MTDHRPSPATRGNGRPSYVDSIDALTMLPAAERAALKRVTSRYAFRANDYYLSLIDWNDPRDPLRQLVIPRPEELDGRDDLDVAGEQATTVAHGVEHRFPESVVVLCAETCGAYCRYCNRKRLFMADNDEVSHDLADAVRYIAAHTEITDVILSGGDPLLLSTRRLSAILRSVGEIPHVRTIRIGTKVPAFDPQRIVGDDALHAELGACSSADKRLYLMAHFDHPREITGLAAEAIETCVARGVLCLNQCPIIRGVNDDPHVLSELFDRLAAIGCPQYYVFQCAPTAGNDAYGVPIVEGWRIFREAMSRGAGLARRARYVMSHASGKVEILGVDEAFVYLRYHRSVDVEANGRVFVRRRDDAAMWLDDLPPLAADSRRVAAP